MEKLYLTHSGVSSEIDLPDTPVTLTKQNFDLFNLNVAKAGYTKKIKLPKTSRNLSFFGFISEAIENDMPYKAITADYYTGGLQLIRNGKCYLDKIDDHYHISLISDIAELKDRLSGPISDIIFSNYKHTEEFINADKRFSVSHDNLSIENTKPMLPLGVLVYLSLANKQIYPKGFFFDSDLICGDSLEFEQQGDPPVAYGNCHVNSDITQFSLLMAYAKKNQFFFYYDGSKIEFVKFSTILLVQPEDWSEYYFYHKSISTKSETASELIFKYGNDVQSSYRSSNENAIGSKTFVEIPFDDLGRAGDSGLSIMGYTNQTQIVTVDGIEDGQAHSLNLLKPTPAESIESIKQKYLPILDVINKTRQVTAYFNFTAADFQKMNFKTLKYIKQLNGYYYLKDAKFKSGDPAEATLIKIK